MASAPTCSPEISLGRYLRFCASRAVAADLVDAQVGVRAVGQADRGRAAADLLHGDAVLEIAEARAAVLLLHRDAVQAERAELRPQLRAETRCDLSISSAIGAISSAVKPRTLARSWSAVSPRSKLSAGKSLGIIGSLSPWNMLYRLLSPSQRGKGFASSAPPAHSAARRRSRRYEHRRSQPSQRHPLAAHPVCRRDRCRLLLLGRMFPLPWPGLDDTAARVVGYGFGLAGLALTCWGLLTLSRARTNILPRQGRPTGSSPMVLSLPPASRSIWARR